MKINLLKNNNGQIEGLPKNPRFIKDERFSKLVNSVKEFPKMMELRQIVYVTHETQNIVIGGNMRLKALIELGFKEVPESYLKDASDLTIEEKKRFIIADNVAFGSDDFDLIANEWDIDELTEWGMEVPGFDEPKDYSDKNKEIDIDELDTEMIIKLKYSEEDYYKVKEAFSKLSQTPEQAVWQLLKL